MISFIHSFIGDRGMSEAAGAVGGGRRGRSRGGRKTRYEERGSDRRGEAGECLIVRSPSLGGGGAEHIVKKELQC